MKNTNKNKTQQPLAGKQPLNAQPLKGKTPLNAKPTQGKQPLDSTPKSPLNKKNERY